MFSGFDRSDLSDSGGHAEIPLRFVSIHTQAHEWQVHAAQWDGVEWFEVGQGNKIMRSHYLEIINNEK